MTMTDSLIAELRQEAEATRRVLERVPDEQRSWRPHPKSLSLGQLALHIAQMPGGVAEFLSGPTGESPDFSTRPQAASRAELLRALDEGVAGAASKLASWGDQGLAAAWR